MKQKLKTELIQIFLEKENKELIIKVARERGLSASSFIGSVILDYIKRGENSA